MASKTETDGAARTQSKDVADSNAAKPGKEAALDLSKVNDLIANVDNRLSGGLHGAFYEEGSRLESSTRHGQLGTLFELRSQLSDVQASLEKQAQRAEAESDKQSKGAVKMNNNLISTIKSIVEQQMAEKIRSLSIENERLRESGKKASDLCDAHENKIKALEVKIKKLEQHDKAEKVTEAKFKTLEGKMASLESKSSTKAEMSSLRQQMSSLQQQTPLESKLATQGELNSLKQEVQRIKTIYNNSRSAHRERLDALEASDIDKDQKLKELEESDENTKEWLQNLADRADNHHEYHNTTLSDWLW